MTAKTKDNKGNPSPLLLILIFILLAAGILVTGYIYYSNYEKNYRAQVEHQLSSIADLKIGELVQWRKERLADANLLYKNPAFSSVVQRYLEDPDDVVAQEQLRSWLAHFQAYDQYAMIFLLDTQGAARISVPDTSEPVPNHIPQDASQVLQSGKVAVLDLDRDEDTQQLHMVILTPIFREKDDSVPLGVVVMRIDPYRYLYPLISSWPTPSTTAETLLIRRDGNDALYLNELRFQKDTALKLRTSLENIKIPAVQAALGHEGIMEGIDYRGVPVIADVRAVPDSPWFMVARVDTSEVYSPLTQLLWVIIALIGALLIGAGAGVGLVQRQRNIRVYKERAEITEVLRESEERYRDLVNFSKNGVAVYEAAADGEDFIFKDFNRAAERIDKIKKEDVIGKSILQAFPGVKEFGLFEVFQRVWRTGVPERHSIKQYRDNRISGWRDNYVYRLSSGEIVAIYEDVTERKQAEEALRESEQNYHLLSTYHSHLNDISLVFAEASNSADLFNKIAETFHVLTGAIAASFQVFNNETRALKIVSLSIDPISRDKLDSIFDPEFFEMQMIVGAELEELMISLLITKPKDLCELTLGTMSRDLSDKFMDAIGCQQIVALAITNAKELVGTCIAYLRADQPVAPDDALKTYTHMAGLAIKRKQMEQALSHSENFLKNIIEKSPIAVWISNSSGTLIQLNQACCDLLNITDDDVVGKYNIFEDNIVEEQGFMPLVRDVFEKGTTVNFTLEYDSAQLKRLPLQRTTYVILEISISAIRNDHGEITNAVIQQVDITERKRAEESLQESESKYRSLVETAGAGVASVDLQGNLTYVNNTFIEMMGYTAEELAGKPFLNFIHPADSKQLQDKFLTGMEKPENRPDLEFRALHKNGNYLWLYSSPTPLIVEGNLTGFTAIATDITDRKYTESELLVTHDQLRNLAARLQISREDERKSIAAEIHDDLGQSLTALQIDLSWLIKRMPLDQKKLLEKAESMLKLVKVTDERVREIATELRPPTLDELGLVTAVQSYLREFKQKTGIKYEFSSEPGEITLDTNISIALFRVLQGALINTAKHAKATLVKISLVEQTGGLYMEISDNGRGITEKELVSRKSIGIIGMRERIAIFGGSLQIEGRPGKGTTVKVKIPVQGDMFE